jgi:hypothetical protein
MSHRPRSPWRAHNALVPRGAFSMIEILIALMFISLAFLPMFHLFRFGQRGTWSNEKEILATNHAADLLNFVRELSVAQIDSCVPKADQGVTLTDTIFQDILKDRLNLTLPPSDARIGFALRTLTLIRFPGSSQGASGQPGSWFYDRSCVPNFLVSVEVDYHHQGFSMGSDRVVLRTIITD